MKEKYFTESAYLDLFDSISNNKNFYCNDKCDWIGKKFKDSKYFKESRIDISLPVLNKEKDSDFARQCDPVLHPPPKILCKPIHQAASWLLQRKYVI